MTCMRPSLFLLSTTLVLGGCVTAPEVVLLGPPGREYDPVRLEDVWVFSSEDRVLVKHQPVAELTVKQTDWDDAIIVSENLIHQLRAEAGKLGAHAVILGGFDNTSRTGAFVLQIPSATATAIRFVGADSARQYSAARTPKNLGSFVVAPLAVPEDIQVHDTIIEGFINDIYGELETAGFNPLPYDTWEKAWAEVGQEPEGAVDPETGFKTGDQSHSQEERILRYLRDEHGVDGFLFPDILGVEAPFYSDEAHWDGIKQKVGETRSTGAKIASGILNAIISGEDEDFEEPEPTGRVAALSLVIRMENSLGAHLFTGRGGIELLQGTDFEGGIYIGDQEPEEYEVVEVPDEALFQKRSRLERAVRIALEPLLAVQGRF